MPGWGLFVLSAGGIGGAWGTEVQRWQRHRPKFRVGWAGPFVPLSG